MQLPPLRLAPRTGKGAQGSSGNRSVVEMLGNGASAAAVIQVAVLGIAVVVNRRKSKSLPILGCFPMVSNKSPVKRFELLEFCLSPRWPWL